MIMIRTPCTDDVQANYADVFVIRLTFYSKVTYTYMYVNYKLFYVNA